jgi:cytoskeletal protein CcmA (bactofilin family)
VAHPLARYRLGRAALDLGAFTVSELQHLTGVPANTIYSFVVELGPNRLRVEELAGDGAGRPRKRYSLKDEGTAYLLAKNLEVAEILRTQVERREEGVPVFRINRDVHILGDVRCGQRVVVEGRVDGRIELGLYDVRIGRHGQVHADVVARDVTVEGLVEGNILAQRRAVLRRSASVAGDVISPDVVVEEGAHLSGAVRQEPTEREPMPPSLAR